MNINKNNQTFTLENFCNWSLSSNEIFWKIKRYWTTCENLDQLVDYHQIENVMYVYSEDQYIIEFIVLNQNLVKEGTSKILPEGVNWDAFKFALSFTK